MFNGKCIKHLQNRMLIKKCTEGKKVHYKTTDYKDKIKKFSAHVS